MKDVLKLVDNNEIHANELSNYTSKQQEKLYNKLIDLMDEQLSFLIISEQIRKDKSTVLGSIEY